MNSNIWGKEKTVTLKIVETSDVHGCFFPYDFINDTSLPGSLARVSSYCKTLRQQHPGSVVLLDNGDILQGQPVNFFSNFVDTLNNNIAADVVNYMGYDAETLGNHDVETGHRCFDAWARSLRCPLLGANVVNTATGNPYFKPYTIINRQGIRIAVLGLLTPAIPNWVEETAWNGMRFDEMVASARKWMDFIQKNEKPDVIVGLFHSGADGGIKTATYAENAALQVARDVPGFNVVLFGHDHTRHNSIVKNKEGKDVVCLDPANNARSIAEATLTMTREKGRWSVTSAKRQLVDVSALPIDSDYVNHFTPYFKKVKDYANRQIGTFTKTIRTRDCFFGNSDFSDLILNLELQLTGADIAFNAPLIIDDSIQRGPIYVRDLFKIYKFENHVYTMRLTGKEIKGHLEMSYDQWANTMHTPNDHLLLLDTVKVGSNERGRFKNFIFNFDSAAGIDYEVDATKPNGSKVHILRMSNGEPFDENKQYLVAVNSYRGNGGGELLTRGAGIPRDSLRSRIVWRSPYDQRHYLMLAIEKLGTVTPQANHNWKFVPEEWTAPAAKRDRQWIFGKH